MPRIDFRDKMISVFVTYETLFFSMTEDFEFQQCSNYTGAFGQDQNTELSHI